METISLGKKKKGTNGQTAGPASLAESILIVYLELQKHKIGNLDLTSDVTLEH